MLVVKFEKLDGVNASMKGDGVLNFENGDGFGIGEGSTFMDSLGVAAKLGDGLLLLGMRMEGTEGDGVENEEGVKERGKGEGEEEYGDGCIGVDDNGDCLVLSSMHVAFSTCTR